jgi:hypothetical protein
VTWPPRKQFCELLPGLIKQVAETGAPVTKLNLNSRVALVSWLKPDA